MTVLLVYCQYRAVRAQVDAVVKQKNKDDKIQFRVRGTAGGNLLSVPYNVSARTADLDVVKLLIQSVISFEKTIWAPLSPPHAMSTFASPFAWFPLLSLIATTYTRTSPTAMSTSRSVSVCTASPRPANSHNYV